MDGWRASVSLSAAVDSAGPLVAVAGSLLRCSQGMSQWSVQELTAGLGCLALRHLQQGLLDTIPTPTPVTSREELLELLHWLRWAMAAYEADTSMLSADLNIPAPHVMRHVTESSHGRPAYVLARDEARRVIVVSVRGTHSSSDVLTDLTLDSCPFLEGWAHQGMLEAARWLHSQLCPKLTQLAHAQGWTIVLVGHSLGAGTAALLAMLLQQDLEHLTQQQQQQQLDPLDALGLLSLSNSAGPPGVSGAPAQQQQGGGGEGGPRCRVQCWAFACPPVVSRNLAARCSLYTRSVVLQHDIVPRLCPEAFEDLRGEVLKELGCVLPGQPCCPPGLLPSQHSKARPVQPALAQGPQQAAAAVGQCLESWPPWQQTPWQPSQLPPLAHLAQLHLARPMLVPSGREPCSPP